MATPLQLGLNTRGPGGIDVLDLRHFSGGQLAPLLREEARYWNEHLHWDYTQSIQLLMEYLDGRVLPGFVAVDANRRILGYAFAVYEANKAVVGDVYAFGEATSPRPSVSATLLDHMLEMLEASPGIERIESQLLLSPRGALSPVFARRGFRSFERLFMLADVNAAPFLGEVSAPDSAFRLERWHADAFHGAAVAIHASYIGHEDAQINDQYQSVAGAERFLQNIIRFPGCGLFDEAHSLLLRDARTQRVEGMLLCSQVQPDTAHITQLCLSSALRGKGWGTQMLQTCAQQLRASGFRAISLTVTEDNAQARKLYESFGFTTRHRFEAMTWDKLKP
jgi:ribosomal protein S18 acetylase RimI-like enzyme